MINSNKEIKCAARDHLQGKYAFPICGYLFIYFLTNLIASLCSAALTGTNTYTIILGQVISIVILLIMTVFDAGLNYMFLNIARGKQCSLQDVFYMTRHHPDRAIMVGIIFTLINYLCTLPQVYFSYMILPHITTYTELLAPFFLCTAGSMLLYALAILVTIPISFSYYLLADHVEMSAGDAIKGSIQMLHGYKWDLFKLELSFMGLAILGILSLGIGFLWIYPYMQTSLAGFYSDLCAHHIQTV